jgi:hypothetical protein
MGSDKQPAGRRASAILLQQPCKIIPQWDAVAYYCCTVYRLENMREDDDDCITTF